jgi:hypothetical protein
MQTSKYQFHFQPRPRVPLILGMAVVIVAFANVSSWLGQQSAQASHAIISKTGYQHVIDMDFAALDAGTIHDRSLESAAPSAAQIGRVGAKSAVGGAAIIDEKPVQSAALGGADTEETSLKSAAPAQRSCRDFKFWLLNPTCSNERIKRHTAKRRSVAILGIGRSG